MQRHVTQQAIEMAPDAVIISHTDLDGRITYANEDFVRYSGYDKTDLIGQTHGILRHPDMPAEAFRDLWATLKRGRPWQAPVKNRCKNGDHYWVLATATPLPDGSGYMSVRTPASAAQIRAAEQLYQAMRKQPDRYRLNRGAVIKGGAVAKLRRRLVTRLASISLANKVLIPLIGGAVIIIGGQVIQMIDLERKMAEQAGVRGGMALIETAKNARMFYTGEVIPEAEQAGIAITHDFATDPHGIPLPASFMRALGEMSQGSGQSGQADSATLRDIGALKLFSDQPFAFRRDTDLDPFEREAIRWLEENPDEVFVREGEVNGQPVIRVGVADVMTDQTCVDCHNSHPDTPKRDWRIGDVRGVISATIPTGAVHAQMKETMISSVLLIAGITAGLLILIALLMRGQARRIRLVNESMETLAQGQLRLKVTPADTQADDEIGNLLTDVLKVRNTLFEVAAELGQRSTQFVAIAEAVRDASGQSLTASQSQSGAASTMAAAVEEMSATIAGLRETATQVFELASDSGADAQSGAQVVDRVQHLNHSIAATVSESANRLDELEVVSNEIDQIVNSIANISEQTNLLALNAAIEAARAGEYGRGFAVVAEEVRSLSLKTSESTRQITDLVVAIQKQIKDSAVEIRHAVEQVRVGTESSDQARAAVDRIRDKSQEVIEAVQSIERALGEQSTASNEVAQSVTAVSEQAHEGARLSAQVSEEIARVQQMSTHLNKLAGRFRYGPDSGNRGMAGSQNEP
ncbi:MAG: methyl-accepting chemotaxis protein [Halothiobacillaceae bacterium]